MSNVLTVDNLPKAVLYNGKTIKENRDFKFAPQAELIAGKTVVVNKTGLMYLYMGDDPRQDSETPENSKQIIVHDFNGNLAFLSWDCRVAVELKMWG